MASTRDNAKPDGNQVMEVTPCTEDGYVTLEYALRTSDGTERRETYFDPTKMCDILKKIKDFSKVRCSKEIGYAIIEYGDKRIHVWKQGRIIIRHAKDRDDATRTLQMVNKILSQAVPRRT